jgi:hypothetical protein
MRFKIVMGRTPATEETTIDVMVDLELPHQPSPSSSSAAPSQVLP